MKNVMKLSLLGLALTVGAQAMSMTRTMNNVLVRGSKAVKYASAHKLATAGVLVGSFVALDLLKNKVAPFGKNLFVSRNLTESGKVALQSPLWTTRAATATANGVVSGSKYAGNKVKSGSRYAGNKVVAGSNWTFGKVKSGAQYVWSKVRRAPAAKPAPAPSGEAVAAATEAL